MPFEPLSIFVKTWRGFQQVEGGAVKSSSEMLSEFEWQRFVIIRPMDTPETFKVDLLVCWISLPLL